MQMYLLIVDDFIFHYDSVWSVGSLPGQCDTVFTLSLLQDHIHCKQSETEAQCDVHTKQ